MKRTNTGTNTALSSNAVASPHSVHIDVKRENSDIRDESIAINNPNEESHHHGLFFSEFLILKKCHSF